MTSRIVAGALLALVGPQAAGQTDCSPTGIAQQGLPANAAGMAPERTRTRQHGDLLR